MNISLPQDDATEKISLPSVLCSLALLKLDLFCLSVSLTRSRVQSNRKLEGGRERGRGRKRGEARRYVFFLLASSKRDRTNARGSGQWLGASVPICTHIRHVNSPWAPDVTLKYPLYSFNSLESFGVRVSRGRVQLFRRDASGREKRKKGWGARCNR